MTKTTLSMPAYRFNPTTLQLTLEEIPVPKPRADEVLVKVLAAGICHSDVSALYHRDAINLEALTSDSFTMGHEGAGVVAELGSAVAEKYPKITTGMYVAVYCRSNCHTCRECLQGKENLCQMQPLHGLGSDGMWASYIAVSASSVFPVAKSIPPEVAAVATDAVLTSYHALKTLGNVQAGQTVLIIGCGGLGQNAVQIAKNCLGAGVIIVTDLKEQSLQLGRDTGADHAVHPDGLRQLLQDLNVTLDIVFDFVGNQDTFEMAAAVVSGGGKIVQVGIGAEFIQVPVLLTAMKEIELLTCFWGKKSEMVEVLDAIAEGKIRPNVEIRPFEECHQVLEELRDGKLGGRVALRLY